MKLQKHPFKDWRWIVSACILIAAVTFAANKIIPPVTPPSIADPPDISTTCRGEFNGKFLTQTQVDKIVELHQGFLARTVGAMPGRGDDPYVSVKRRDLEPLIAVQGLADPLPQSVKGAPIEISDADRADFCGARLKDIELGNKDLRFARFMGARLEQVNLSGANLDGTFWKRVAFQNVSAKSTSFRWANLAGALIYESDFSKSNLFSADMSYADIANSNFSEARFEESLLNGAYVRNTSIDRADFVRSSLIESHYEAKPGSLPNLGALRSVVGLTTLQTAKDNGLALRELEAGLDKAGLKIEAAKVRESIVGAKAITRHTFQQGFEKIFYGLPHSYGQKGERLLLIGALLVPTFAMLYAAAIFKPGTGSVWLIRDAPHERAQRKMKHILLSPRNCRPWQIALLFSVRSAFRIGWKNFNVGDWIARLQGKAFTLEGDGWVRTVSGLQSLVSLYLLALAIVSYIG